MPEAKFGNFTKSCSSLVSVQIKPTNIAKINKLACSKINVTQAKTRFTHAELVEDSVSCFKIHTESLTNLLIASHTLPGGN